MEVEAAAGREGVVAEMEGAGEAASTFRELAVGFNPLLAVPGGGGPSAGSGALSGGPAPLRLEKPVHLVRLVARRAPRDNPECRE